MAPLPFASYRPDVSDLRGNHTRRLRNVIPRADGYGPVGGLEALTAALPAACRGYFLARRGDSSVALFAGTEDRLYLLDNTTLTWDDVSLGGAAYTPLVSSAHWSFAQFGNFIFATQANVVLQRYDLASSSAFAVAPGSPPQAGGIANFGRFLALYDLAANPFRVHWCGLNDTTNWTAGTGFSDFQDMPDGGRVLSVVGAEMVAFVLQESAIRRMIYAAGSDVVMQIERISTDRGLLAPYSVAQVAGLVFFLSPQGFVQLSGDGAILPIGAETVDATFLADYDSGNMQLVIGAADPRTHNVLWVYCSTTNSADTFNKGLIYNWLLKRWAPIEIEGEFLAAASRPGLTLEGLDAIAPGVQSITNAVNNGAGLIRLTVGSTAGWSTGDVKTISAVGGVTAANGTHTITVINATTIDLQGSTFAGVYTSGGIVGGSVDALTFSLDSISSSTLADIAAVNASHELCLLNGPALEAELETAEQRIDGWRIGCNGFWPLTDAADVYGTVGARDNLNAAATYATESAISSDGHVPLLIDTRGARFKLRIPAGTAWTYASGVDLGEDGMMKLGRA